MGFEEKGWRDGAREFSIEQSGSLRLSADSQQSRNAAVAGLTWLQLDIVCIYIFHDGFLFPFFIIHAL